MEKETISVTELGAVCDGSTDSTDAFKKAFCKGKKVFVPFGRYTVSETLVMRGGTELFFDRGAALFASPTLSSLPLISSENSYGTVIDGGLFCHPYLDDSGAVIMVRNSSQNRISNVEFRDCKGSCISLFGVCGFDIENIAFSSLSQPVGCGIIIGGGCRNGNIKKLFAKTEGQTKGFLLTLDSQLGDIRSIRILELCAERCGGFIFIHSRGGKIDDIFAKGIYGGTDCAAKLICDTEAHRIEISDIEIYSVSKSLLPLIDIHGTPGNTSINSFSRPGLIDSEPFSPTLSVTGSEGVHVVIDGLYRDCATRAFGSTKAKNMGLDLSKKLCSFECVTAHNGKVICPDGGFSRLYINNNEKDRS